ncbi:MAG: S41 family peptidase [Planctomycetota bacterium]
MSALVSVLWSISAAVGTEGYYRFPAIHGDTIVFACEGDLWRVSAGAGMATRLTSHDGNEDFPHFSPDGEWLAFSGEYQGNVDVYVMPATGGAPRRLTFGPLEEQVVGWRPDGSRIIYRARHAYPGRETFLSEVPLGGGQPRAFTFGPGAQLTFTDDPNVIVFNRWPLEGHTWKRYHGGEADDLWLGDLVKSQFRKLTDWPGVDSLPMWHAGRIYFLSDRSGIVNIFSMQPDGSDVRQHTRHETFDARWPSLQGGHIVYMHGGDLWLYEIASDSDRALEITLASDRVRQREHFADASATLESYTLDREGKHVAIASRGELWTAPTRKGRIVQVTQSSGVRERAPCFSPDGKSLAAISDETGEQEITTFALRGNREHRALTHGQLGWLNAPVYSPDGKWIAYSDLTMSLVLVDVATGASRKVDQSTEAEIGEYAFSPDSQWLAYSKALDHGMRAIFLDRLSDGETAMVTSGFTNDLSPRWDADGKYLFFLSSRVFDPVLGDTDLSAVVTRSVKPCALILAQDGKSPFLPDELLDEAAATGDAKDHAATVRIDLDGIVQRVVEFPVAADNIGSLAACSGKVFYTVAPVPGLLELQLFGADATPRATLHAYDLKKHKDEVLIERLRDYVLSGDGKRIAWRVGEEILVADSASKPGAEVEERVDPSSLSLSVNPSEEWAQIFDEAWRLQRDFYWTPTMVGVDWRAMRARYARLLPRIGTRAELNDLIGQLIGELNTSHTYVMGGDLAGAKPLGVGVLGADIELDPGSGLHRFTRICRAEPFETDAVSPLLMSHVNVHEGDYLLAIDGRALGAQDSVDERLANLAGQQLVLTVARQADRSDARDVQVEALRTDGLLRYRDWCRRNREYVLERSQGRVGYLHLPDMMGPGLREFHKGFYPQIGKDALLIDARYNGGGFVSQLIIEVLARRPYAYMKPRRGRTTTFPERVHLGYKAVLTNQHAGSDGDIFPETFQLKQLGPVIGMRTWGGVVGLNDIKSAIDGGITTQPTAAWWEERRGWDLEGSGVIPDIEVDYLPGDYAAGRDPQLERGVDELMKMLKERPLKQPSEPPVPNRALSPARQ